jgi:predicted ATPase
MQAQGEAFVGRHGELACLQAELDQVEAGAPRAVWLEGEAGVGKTALVRHFFQERPDLASIQAAAGGAARRL